MLQLTGDQLTRAQASFKTHGYATVEGFLDESECSRILADVAAAQASGKFINVANRSLIARQIFLTLNGDDLLQQVPLVGVVDPVLAEVTSQICSMPLVPLENRTVGLSLNVTGRGGELSWHYDRNFVTAVLYANAVSAGGEFLFYPRYRLRLEPNHFGWRKTVQRVFDTALRPSPMRSTLGRLHRLRTQAGMLVLMDSRCLHAVAPVESDEHRVAIVLCYDKPGKVFSKNNTRNYYGYKDQAVNLYR